MSLTPDLVATREFIDAMIAKGADNPSLDYVSMSDFAQLYSILIWDDLSDIVVAINDVLMKGHPWPPDKLAASEVSADSAHLTWDPGFGNIDGHRLYRKTGDGDWTQIGGDLSAETGAYDDSELDPETDYAYRVLAFNNVANPKSLPIQWRAGQD